MQTYKIRKMNAIAQEGLDLFTEQFQVSAEETDPDGIVVRSSPVDVDDYPSLSAVARAGAGVNNINVDRATEKGICVFNTPGANANAVVDLVFPMLGVWKRNIHKGIAFCQSLAEIDASEVSKVVEQRKAAFKGEEIFGKTLAVVGLGQIGMRLANGGIHRNMEVRGYDPSPAVENIHKLLPEVKICRSLKDAIGEADVVSIHLPLNEQTKGLVNADFVAKIKQGAILVNYSREQIVDEQAVLAALDAGHLSAYLTDFPTAENIGHPKVLSTPHLGASTAESEGNCATMAVKELSGYLKYGNVVRSVNFPNIESTPADNVHTRLIVINKDVPGMIGVVSNIFGEYDLNIASYLNQSNGTVGYNIIDVESAIPDALVEAIKAHGDVIRTRTIVFR